MRRLLFLAALLALPIQAWAAPAAVTGLSAERTANGVMVRWEAVPDAAHYRMYFGRQSILRNDGAYDDFLTTTGALLQQELTTLPPGETLFIAVLAEDAAGAVSPGFAEEASVAIGAIAVPHISGTMTGTMEPSMTLPSMDAMEPFRLLSATATSPTTLLLTFSHRVMIDTAESTQAFRILRADGNMLSIPAMQIDGANVLLTTERQQPGVAYQLLVSGIVRGIGNDGAAAALLALDPTTSQTLFAGTGAVMVNTTDPRGVRSLQARSLPNGDATFTVDVQWAAPENADSVAGYRVLQRVDNGPETVSTVGADITAVHVSNVPSGIYTLTVKTVLTTGDETSGATTVLTLGAPSPTPSQPTPVPPMPTPDGNLPQTGATIGFIGAVAGAVAGMKRRKRA